MGDCRFYEQKYPEIDDAVMVMVKRVAEMGAYVQLLEYQNVEGMILLSELSKRRIRSVAKLIRVGRIEVCSVLRVDHEKGYIDLSKKRVSPEDAQKAEEWYAKSKAVHSIMRHVSSQTEVPVQELCQKSALMKGLSVSTPELEVKIKLVAPPQYVLLANCMDREQGLAILDDAIKLIKEDIEKAGGTFTLRTKPEVVGDNDELGVGDLAAKGSDDSSSE